MPNSKPLVFSYLRFSTPEQLNGDSQRRQLQKAEQWCKAHNLTLQDSFQDLGISAFTGRHRKKGNLGKFLDLVKSGKIPPGSILLIESLDRLSREEIVTAHIKFLELINAGIRIITLIDNQEFSKDQDTLLLSSRLIMSLLEMTRAHEESRIKSLRLKDAWKQKREQASHKIITSRCPSWLKPLPDKSGFQIIPKADKAIKKIFELKLEGLGSISICRHLNQHKYWCNSKYWNPSYVKKILRNPAVIGLFQPYEKVDGKRIPAGDPIPNYYPRIIPDKLFYSVQNKLESTPTPRGRPGKIRSLFSGLLKCGYCNQSMDLLDKRGILYLQCHGYRIGTHCCNSLFPYNLIESLTLKHIKSLDLSQLLVPERTPSINLQEAIKEEIKALEERLDNLFDQIEITSSRSLRIRYESRIIEIEARLQKLKNQQIQFKPNPSNPLDYQSQIIQLNKKMKKLPQKQQIILREKLRDKIFSLIDKIFIYPLGLAIITPEMASIDPRLKPYIQSRKLRCFEIVYKNLRNFRQFIEIEPSPSFLIPDPIKRLYYITSNNSVIFFTQKGIDYDYPPDFFE